jgi:hypothetical protein
VTRLVVTIVVLVVTLGSARAQGVSPGSLAKDHASLEGVDNCIRCHSSGDAISATLCLNCHKALGQRIATRSGYHATTGNDCARCHPDHRGVNAALVKWPGGKPESFDHAKAGYKLDGGHAKVACRDCHKVAWLTGNVAPLLTDEEKPRTYLGLPTACAGCHKDVHQPSLGSDCQRCHTPATWHIAPTSTAFDHGKTKYPLLGAHAKVACEKCHGGTAQKLTTLHPEFATCQSCHKDPHSAAMGDAKSCATCHRESAWKDLRYDRKTHAPRTLPLVAGHATPTCADCHGAKVDRKPAAACVTCHADPHRPSLGTRCDTCHQTSVWTKATPKADFHDKTAYPLRGLHVSVACDKCHDPTKPMAKRFRPVAHAKCLDCHADPHLGEASKPCESCHAVEGFKPARFEASDHAKTKFALDGAHRATPCGKCHPSAPTSPGFKQGNPPCETCHDDPHDGQFVDRGGCATCHGVAAWSPSTYTKEAHAKAGFALVGEHDVACGRCHAKQFVKLSAECGSCHDDRHAGQFASRTCIECHAGAVWKPAPGFDHAKTFPLRGRHAKAECARCHPAFSLSAPNVTVKTEVYVLGQQARECIGCHRAQHGDASSTVDQRRELAAATRACATCHSEATWRDSTAAPTFDHRTTGAPLVGGHSTSTCAGCHQPSRRALPELANCSACHQDRHRGRMGDRCETCHSPQSWKQDQLLLDHRRTRLPLAGAHAVQGCPSCHRDAEAGTYRGLDPTCRACHFKTVEERRPHPDHTKDLVFNTCETCHTVTGWRPAKIDHNVFWPLTGKHRTTACTACHRAGEQYRDASRDCNSCHASDVPTGGLFDHASQNTVQCQTCHNTSRWSTAQFPNHPRDFPAKHGGASCAQCHPQGDGILYSCTTGGCHRNVDDKHDDVRGYDQSCARAGCHFGGSKGDD